MLDRSRQPQLVQVGSARDEVEVRLQFSYSRGFHFKRICGLKENRRAPRDLHGQFIHALAGDKPDGLLRMRANQGKGPRILPVERAQARDHPRVS